MKRKKKYQKKKILDLDKLNSFFKLITKVQLMD